MSIGPLQIVVVGFDTDKNFRGQILEELNKVCGRNLIKPIDLLFLHKDDSGQLNLMTSTDSYVEPGDFSQYGAAIASLLGLGESSEASTIETNGASIGVMGISPEQIQQIARDIQPGTAVGVLLFEHVWAADLAMAIRDAEGHLLAQGILTPDAMLVAGQELMAIAEAEAVIEATEAIKNAAMLEAIAFTDELQVIQQAEKRAAVSAVSAETLRLLIAEGLIDNTEVEPAIKTLIQGGLMDVDVVEQALQDADAVAAELEEAMAVIPET